MNQPQQRINSQKTNEKVTRTSSIQKENNIKVIPSQQPQIKQNNPPTSGLQINQIIQYNLQNKLQKVQINQQEIQNQINSQSIQNLVKQLNQQAVQNQPDSSVLNNSANASK